MKGSLAALACLSGCAQLFGIDQTTGKAPPGKATMTLTRESVGATVISSPQDVSSLMATFYVPDAADMTVLDAIPGVPADINVWEADVATGNPTIVFTQPDLPAMYDHLLAFPSRAVHSHFNVFEHPSPQPPPSGAMENVVLTLPTPYDGVQTFDVYVVGAWMDHPLAGAELPMSATSQISTTIPYSAFNPMTASPASSIAASDAVLVLRHTGNQLTGVYQQPGFDQTGATDLIGGNGVMMDEVAALKTVGASITPSTYNARFQTVRPGVTPSTLAMGWAITAAPGYTVGAINGPRLQAGTQQMADTMLTNTSYGNPFESQGWHAVLQFLANETRTFTVGSATLTFVTQIQTVTEASTASMLDLPAPLPEQISIDTHQLNSDGSNVPLDVTLPHTVSILAESTPAASYYFCYVNEITISGAMVTTKIVIDARSAESSITLPAGVFKTGSMYTITAGAIAGGYLNAADGDLDTLTLPFTFSQADSGLFTVVAP